MQALHLACEAGPSATYDVTAWPSGRPSRVMVSSAAGLIITVTATVRGKPSNGKQGARQGQALSRMIQLVMGIKKTGFWRVGTVS